MGKWKQIKNDFFDEFERCINIDAWKTYNDNEEGKVIAKVFADRVEYFDNDAKTDYNAQIVIKNSVFMILDVYQNKNCIQ